MAAFRSGEVLEVLAADPELVRVRVAFEETEIVASGFPRMIGPVKEGDEVVVNMTGVDLDLGTGGEGFLLWNLDGTGVITPGAGHIVKMRYTPWQTEVFAAEAPESPHHEALREVESVHGMPVVACSLHSQVGAVAAGIKAAGPDARVGYLMTDGAALPLAWSRSVQALRNAELVDVTATCGHAFGGDLEAVNVFSGIAALSAAGDADAVVVAMGPGVVGTGTTLGSTALEQGQILDAASALGGRAIAALRISFADVRSRHVGVSHHTLTALRLIARDRCTVVTPWLPEEQSAQVRAALEHADIFERHDVVESDGGPGLRLLAERGVRPSSMGRSLDEVPELFVAASAAGAVAGELLDGGD